MDRGIFRRYIAIVGFPLFGGFVIWSDWSHTQLYKKKRLAELAGEQAEVEKLGAQLASYSPSSGISSRSLT